MVNKILKDMLEVKVVEKITLKVPVKFNYNSATNQVELKNIFKKKNIWKISDAYNNEFTIFSLPLHIQKQISDSYFCELIHRDYQQDKIYLFIDKKMRN